MRFFGSVGGTRVFIALLVCTLQFSAWNLHVLRRSSRISVQLQAVQWNPYYTEDDNQLPRYYDAAVLEKYYNKRPVEVWERLIEIGSPILGWWLASRFENFTAPFRDPDEQAALLNIRAADLKESIVQGKSVTFIKSGQALALRPDLLQSAEYVRELQKLQDEVGTFDHDIAMDIISKDLGRPAEEVYEFDPPYPIASASIGQVYRARLRENNALVAVKVQRPEALRTVGIDMYILRKIAAYVRKSRKLRSDLEGVVDEFGAQLYQELNYRQEAANCIRFKELYGTIPGIYVPDVYLDYTGQRVLTLEFIEGEKGPWKEGGEQMLTVGLQCSVLQLLGTGFFHSDPHRGNLLKTKDGRLAYLDFGMMSEVPGVKRYAMIGTVLGLVNKDLSLIINSLAELDFFPPETDTSVVINALNTAIMNSTEQGKVSSLNFSRLNENIARIQDQLPVRLPPYYTMIIRSLTILEGLALFVDKEFRLVKGAYPFILRQVLSSPQPEMNRLLRKVLLDEEGRINWRKLEQFLSISSSADKAMAGNFEALKSAQDKSDLLKQLQGEEEKEEQSSLELVQLITDFLLSDNGRFLRDPLLDEIVETLEALQLTAQSLASQATSGFLPSPSSRPDQEKVSRFMKLLNLVAQEGGGEAGGEEGEVRGVVSTARGLLRALQSAQSRGEQWQGVVGKLSVLGRQVVGRLVERAARRSIKRVFNPKRVEETLPILARVLDFVPR